MKGLIVCRVHAQEPPEVEFSWSEGPSQKNDHSEIQQRLNYHDITEQNL